MSSYEVPGPDPRPAPQSAPQAIPRPVPQSAPQAIPRPVPQSAPQTTLRAVLPSVPWTKRQRFLRPATAPPTRLTSLRTHYLARHGALPALLITLCACSPHASDVAHIPAARIEATQIEPVATIQELMQSEVDASADSIWDAVETTTTASGDETKQPRTAEEWRDVRRNAIVLIEAANLLTVPQRKLSTAPFPSEAAGALDSTQIAQRIATSRAAFNQYALTLRQTAQTMLGAIDAKDSTALVSAGAVLDEVCESCHMTFWYPNQVIPPFPHRGDPRYQQIAINPTK
jgi:hypothetical protein